MDKVVTIIIPTFNNGATIKECLDSIYSILYPSDQFEVIVVDGGSTDITLDIIKKYPIKLLFGGKTPAEARNIGIKNAKGEIVSFTDADCRVRGDWISVLLRHFDDPLVGGVGGPNITPQDDPFLARCIGTLMESFLGSAGVRNTVTYEAIREVPHNPPVNSAIRKRVLEEVGGFNPRFAISEDVDLDARIRKRGYKLIYDPSMIVWHHRRQTIHGFLGQMFGYGRGRASASLKHPKSLPLTYFCTMAFTIGTILSIPLYVTLPLLGPVISCSWLGYFLFTISSSIFLAFKKREVAYAIIIPLLASLEHFALGLGFIVGLIRPQK